MFPDEQSPYAAEFPSPNGDYLIQLTPKEAYRHTTLQNMFPPHNGDHLI